MSFFRRKRRSLEDLQAEIASHLELEADELRDAGRSVDAEGEARRAFGNVAALEEKWYEAGRWTFFDHLRRELRDGFRQMRRRPGFSFFVMLTLGAGIGANTTMFSVVEAVLIRSLPYEDPGRLAMLFSGDPARELHEGRVSLMNFADWRARNSSFADMTAYIGQTFLLRTNDVPERMRSARVTANFWPLLGVHPTLGRVFTDAEESRAERLAVVSYELWQRHYGGAADVLGRSLQMDDRTYTVIGVMPPGFRYPFADTMVWEPVTAHPYWTTRDHRNPRLDSTWLVLGRLKPGVTISAAQQEMNDLARSLRAQFPGVEMPVTIPVVPLDLQLTGRFRLSLWLLFGAVFVILLIACINICGLLLAHGWGRQREFAIRRSLGASRWRIASQVMTETLVLAAAGGAIGLVLAAAASGAVRKSGAVDIPRLGEAHVDWPALGFTVAVSIFTALAASVWPAMRSSRTRLASREWTPASTRHTGDLLVVGQFMLALVLMVSAMLLARSFLRVRMVEPGFRADHLLRMRIDLHVGRTRAQQTAYFEEAVRRAEAVPGVVSAGAATGFLRSDAEDSVEIEGSTLQHPGPAEDWIAGHFFEAAGVSLKRGRTFSDRDGPGAPAVAVINEAMSRSYWPGQDPLGKRFRFRESTPWITVVGVTGDMRRQGIDHPAAPQVFLPLQQGSENMMDVIVRTALEPGATEKAVRDNIQAIDRSVARFGAIEVSREIADETGELRLDTMLLGGFAMAALLLAATGVYVLLHYTVLQRRNEIGLRMALGATPEAISGMLLRRGLKLALLGGAFGLAGAWAVGRLLTRLLYEIAPTDPVTFGVSVIVLFAVAGTACWFPARRAARISPVIAMQGD